MADITTCSVPDCAREVHIRGWCRRHYTRWQRHGDPLGGRSNTAQFLSCTVTGCPGKQGKKGAHGLCSKHYQQMLATGSPTGTKRPSAEVRFLAKVIRTPTGCWLWGASRDQDGYGIFSDGGTATRAHIWAYRSYVGTIPVGHQLDHLCRKRACVNPEHLEPVTPRENSLRGDTLGALNAAKTHCIRGHAFTPDNTYYRPAGGRVCRTCVAASRARYEQRKAA